MPILPFILPIHLLSVPATGQTRPRLGARESTEAIHAGQPPGTGQSAQEQIWASNQRIKSTVEI